MGAMLYKIHCELLADCGNFMLVEVHLKHSALQKSKKEKIL